MQAYLDILRNVLDNGVAKQPVRRGPNGEIVPVENGTIGTFCEVFRYDMSKGLFPALTTRKIAWKSVRIELQGFLQGQCSKLFYKDKGCHFWDFWANPEVVNKRLADSKVKNEDSLQEKIDLRKKIQEEEDDLGTFYAHQMRRFDEHYGKRELRNRYVYQDIGPPEVVGQYEVVIDRNGVDKGTDQLKSVLDQLTANPYDRRMFVSYWNPNQISTASLPSCHTGWNVVVYGNKLNLVWNQRSCDLYCGIPHNIAFYGLLLLLLCKHSNLEPGELVGTFHDCHLYNNQIEDAKLQLSRSPLPLPEVKIKDNKDGGFDVLKWEWDDVEMKGYQYHPAIKGKVTV